MAGRLAYYNHNYQQHHSQFLRHYPSTSFSSASIVSPSNLDSSSFSSSSSTSSSSTSTSPSACLTSSASQSLAGSSAGVAAAAAAAAAAAVDLPSHPQSIQPQHSLSSWAEWPADQLQNRPLGSVEDTGKGKGTSTSTSSSSSLSKGLVGIRNRTRTVGSAPRTRRLASSSSSSSPRHIHQRPARRMNRRPPASSSDSASPPSLLRCCSGSDDCKTSPGAPNPTMISSTNNNTASNTTDATSISVAAAPPPPNIMPDATPRPGKRSTDGSTPDDPTSHAAGKLKLPRLERGPDDFSSVVKNRLQSYTRTGQACDRCKVRKIRCDALPEGCSHCINLNLDCYVTDRVTGRTERRGYMQQLEREKNGMLSYIRELEKLLGDNGVDVKPWQGPASAPQNVDENLDAPPSSSSSAANDWTQSGSVWVKSKSPSSNSSSATPSISLRPKLRASSSTDIDEQIQTDGNETMALKSIKGTKLRLLDMEIDTAGFEAPEMDEPADPLNAPVPLYKRSFQAFLQSTYKINPIIQMEMPSRHDAFTFCDWYFLVFAPFFPILHKPTFMRMVTRIYDEPGFEPNDCEQLTLHTVFAIIYHNYGVRNWQLEGRIHFTSLADKHYHFALSKFYDVLSRHDLPAVQALTLLAIYMRSFPKPKLATHVIGLALEKAMNLGLHRKDETPSSGTNINKELRKRVWWSIVAVAVFTFGRLGRPMIITSHEFDTDLPEPIADEHLKEHGVDAEQTVAFQYGVGLALQKLTKISIEIYTHLYSARRDLSQYSQILEVLEEQLQEWDTALPDHLRLDKPLHPDTMVQPYYTRMFFLEIRLCLRHPSLAPATDKQLREENSRITEEISREMLKLALEVIKYRAIDTSWYHVSLFVVCIFSTLSVNWDRRFEMSPEKMAMLRDEMGRWLSVIKDVCILMGNGPGFLFEVTRIVDRTVSWIEHDMNGQDFNKSLSSPPTLLSQTLGPTGFDYTRAAAAVPVTLGPAGTAPNLRSFYGKGTSTDQAGFSVLPYGAQPQGAGAMPAYTSEQAIFYSTSMQPATTSLVTVAPNEPSLQTNPLMAFATQSTQHVGPSSQTDMMWQNRGPTWNDWESTVADNQDRYNNSNILNFTAGSRGSLPSDDAVDQAPVDIGFLPHSQWPMNLFENGPDNGPSGV